MVSSVAILAQPAPPSPTSPQDGTEKTIIRAISFYKNWLRLNKLCALILLRAARTFTRRAYGLTLARVKIFCARKRAIFVTHCAFAVARMCEFIASVGLEQAVGTQIFPFFWA